MKTKLAVILGIICIAVSAVTLFSVLGHADPASSTMTFVDLNGLSAPLKDAYILSSDPSLLRLDMAPIKFPKEGEISVVIIKFSDSYDAAIAREILMKARLDLSADYIISPQSDNAKNPRPAETLEAVNSDGQTSHGKAAQGLLIYSDRVYTHPENSKQSWTIQDMVSKQIRDDQLNKGIYVGTYGKVMWILDGIRFKCGPNVKSSCHAPAPEFPAH